MSSSSNTPPIETADAPLGSGADSKQIGNGKRIEKTISCVSCRRRKLKCDRIKPKCATCARLRHDCEYPERRRNLGSKRRNMKELEARLAQVETQLVSESKASSTQPPPGISTEPDWNDFGEGDLEMNIDFDDAGMYDQTYDISQGGLGIQGTDPSFPMTNFGDFEIISLGLQEPLPPQEMIDELQDIYFERFHPHIPMIHKYRYLASLDRAPQARPPICLRYAIWAMAASLSDKYRSCEQVFYERARKYIHEAEMKGQGEVFVNIYHAQTWGIISSLEANKTLFSRSWMSTGRMVRLCHMLGLYRLDGEGVDIKQILPPAKDWIELEERRRTFWASFYGDRWASSGTGWPMIIDEAEIMTNLPASEECFENGTAPAISITLAEALTPQGARELSPFSGVILSATLFGHNFKHLHKRGPNEKREDVEMGEFWQRHRTMDNILANTFMFLPDHLKLPSNLRNMSVVFLHMNIHASVICLHRAAVLTAEKYHIEGNVLRQSRARSLMAAEEIGNIMRLVSHVDPAQMNTWIGFCLYVAGGIFIQDLKSDAPSPHSRTTLEFLLAAMRAIGQKHTITRHFTAQLELDIEGAKLPSCHNGAGKGGVLNIPMYGILADREGLPMTAGDFQNPVEQANTHKSSGLASVCQALDQQHRTKGQKFSSTSAGLSPSSGVATAESRKNSSGGSPDPASGFVIWDSIMDEVYDNGILVGCGPKVTTTCPPADNGINAEKTFELAQGKHFLANTELQYNQSMIAQSQSGSDLHIPIFNNAIFPSHQAEFTIRQAERSPGSLPSAAVETADLNEPLCPYISAEPTFPQGAQPTEPSPRLFRNSTGDNTPLSWLKPINFDEPELSWQVDLSQPDPPTATHPDHEIPSWMN